MTRRLRRALSGVAAAAIIACGTAAVVTRYPWFPSWVGYQIAGRESVPAGTPTHILFCVTDHFEPHDLGTVMDWVQRYPALAHRHHDADGRPPRHSWFWYFEGADDDTTLRYLQALARLAYEGFGEVELHLHHGGETPDELTAVIEHRKRLAAMTGAFVTAEPQPRATYGFIHGMWALDNSRDGKYCGVNNELRILRRTGCYADFTHPSWGSMLPRMANRIYYALDDLGQPKSYDRGRLMRAGGRPWGDLLIIQGPMSFQWANLWRGGPVYDHGDLTVVDEPTPARTDRWIRQAVHVQGRPDWLIVKAFTHGAVARDREVLLGLDGPVDRMHADLNRRYNDGARYQLHYVTARELYNIVKAAEAGKTGSPNDYRDFLIPPYANTRLLADAPYELVSYTPETVTVRPVNGAVRVRARDGQAVMAVVIEEPRREARDAAAGRLR